MNSKSTLVDKNFNLRILVISCEDYSDLWPPFVYCFQKYWPKCKWPVDIITDASDFKEIKGFQIKSYGKSLPWSDVLKKALESIDENFVLLMLEDFLLKSTINNSDLNEIITLIRINNINMFRLIPRPAPSKIKNKKYGEIAPNEKWRVSTQAAIWNKEILLKILKSNESPWDFEINGTRRANKYSAFFGTKNHIIKYYHHDVQRGLWFPWSIIWMTLNRVPFNKKSRKIMSFGSTLRYLLIKFLFKIRSLFSPK